MNVFLDNASTTPLTDSVKKYLISILDEWGNPSSLHSKGTNPKQIISEARKSAAKFINANEKEIYFVPSGSAGNTLAVKGLVSDNPEENKYEVFYSPTAHKSMLKVCESCRYHTPLNVNSDGEINLDYLEDILTRHNAWKPLVCIEAANSEIGTINDVITIGNIVHKYNGVLVVDATGYIPDAVQSMSTINGMRIIMIGLPIIFVIISFIVYKKYYKLNSEYMTRIMNILSLKKEENRQLNKHTNK